MKIFAITPPRALIVILLSFAFLPGFSQVGSFREPVPNTPNVAAMMKVGEIPISYHTGVADISIPIHTVSDGSLSVPITLTYHSSGTKVEEVAGWTGLGWSLSAGGAITRTVIGGLDEGANTSYGNSSLTGSGFYKDYGIPDPVTLCSPIPSCEGSGPVGSFNVVPDANTIDGYDNGTDDDENDIDDEWMTATSNPPECNCKDFGTDAASGYIDTEPDLFFFNFNGVSGKFFFDENRKIHCIPEQDLKIEPEFTMTNVGGHNQLGFESWKVTAPDGTKYFFGETYVEYGHTDAIGAGGTAINNITSTTWYLYAIESVNNENQISISYEPDNFGYRNRTSHSVSIGEWTAPTSSATIAPATLMTTTATGWRISHILAKHDFEEVYFLTSENVREDLIGNPINQACTSKPLGEIKITHNGYGSCKRFVFDYGYFTSPNTNTNYDNLDVTDKKRLRLNSLQEFNCLGESIPAYLFYYNETPIGRRFSLGRDAWGYYNGADQNAGLLPDNIDLDPYFTINPHGDLMGNANRDPNADYMKACMLDSIRYPTGGVVSFEYEPHFLSGQTIGGMRIHKIKYDDKLSDNPVIKAYEYISGYLYTTSPITIYDSEPGLFEYDYDGDFGVHIYSTPSTPLYSSQGYHIGYSQVNVLHGDGSKSSYYYSAYPSGSSWGFPVPPQQYQIGGGELLREEHRNDANATISSKDYSYNNTIGGVNIAARKVATLTKMPGMDANCSTCGYGDTYVFYKDYYIYSARHQLSQITETLDGVTKVTNFEYDPQNRHGNPVITYFDNSDDKEHRSETKYAHEADPAIHPQRQAMLDNYMIGIPLEQVTYVDGNLIGGGRLKYANFSGLLAPKYFYKIEDSDGVLQENDFELKGTVTEYYTNSLKNSYGMPKKFQKEGYPNLDIFTFSDEGLLTQKRYRDRYWYYTYSAGTNLLKSVTDYNEQRTDYEYDGFWRLKKVKSRPNSITSPTSWNIITEYTYEYTGIKNAVTTSTTFSDAPAVATKQWSDGLGRPVSTHNINHTPDGDDLVTAVEYDNMGREWRRYLPFEGATNGAFTTPGNTAYTEIYYEKSPLGRPLKETLPSFGEINYSYGSNTGDIKHHPTTDFYTGGLLYKKVVIDENGNPTETYSDKIGQTILVRKFVENQGGGQEYVNTYYVYEDDGDLGAVVTPLATDTADHRYAYHYTYDARHRMTSKSIPGAGVTTLTYNNMDFLKTTLDAKGNKLIIHYDVYNRDTATFLGNQQLTGKHYIGVKDWIDHTRVKVMDEVNTNWWLNTGSTLDMYGRATNVVSDNHLGTGQMDMTDLTINHAGQVLNTQRQHDGIGWIDLDIQLTNTYDNGGRLTDVQYALSGGDPIITSSLNTHLSHMDYTYRDELSTKWINGTPAGAPFPYLQKIDYQYNLRGFLTKINQMDLMTPVKYLSMPPCPEEEPEACNPIVIKDILLEVGIHKSHLTDGISASIQYRFDGGKIPCQEGAITKDTVLLNGYTVPEAGYTDTLYISLETPVTDSATAVFAMAKAAKTLSESMTQLGLTIPAGFDPEVAALAAYAGTLDPNAGTQTEQVISGVLLQLDDDLDMGVIDPYVIPPSIDSLDLFAMELYYASSNTAIQSEPQFNGNISQIVWQAAGRHKQSYGYQYDGLNRLTKATYADLLCTAPNTGCVYVTNDHYSEPLISYDQMGNITRLQRYGVEKKEAPRGYCYDELMIDDLFYSYDGNRLIALSDYTAHGNGFTDGTTTTQEYAYDANGNMISDQNKGITSITYNHLNLPKKIIFATGAIIEILYDATGVKLRKKTTAPDATITTTDYCGGIEYVNGELISVYHSEGRVVVYETQENIHAPIVKRYRHEYVLRDHLGNSRVTFSDLNGDNAIQPLAEKTQENNYYSFGMNMEGPWSGSTSGYKYQYNGKELNDDFGLGWNDYGARWYDAAVGRWWVVDPLAHKMPAWSPYSFSFNNPILYIDPDGAFPIEIHVRSFAPFDYFGGGLWKGDGNNRRFSTIYNGNTSRIRQITSYETTTMVSNSTAYGGQSHSRYGANAFSDAKIEDDFSFGNRIYTHLSGDNDALVPGVDYGGPTHDIDVWTDIHIGVTENEDGSSILSLTGDLAGDGFPSSEAFVTDGSGKNKVFLGVGAAKAGPDKGPFITLAGDKKEKQFDINVRIAVDKKGNFTGVYSTDSKGKETVIPISEWNKQFENQSPK